MNKIYKVIWNATLLAWVAVSELAKGKTKSSKVTGIIGAATVSLMVTFSPEASAAIINTDTSCVTGSAGAVGNINPGTTGTQATDGSGTYSLVAGCNAKGNNNLAATVFGSFSEVTGTAGTALGHNSQANAFGTAVGVESRATAAGSTAIGEGTQSTGQNAVALGGTATGTAAGNVLSVANAVTASGSGAVAIGGNATRGAQSAGTDAVAIGAQSTVAAAGTGAVALGARSNASAATTVAIGDGANASIAGSIALGASSTTSASVNSTAQTINGKSYTATGTASTGVVSVGSGSIKRQIQNVAAGQVTASSTDAVNGSQLFNTNTELAKVATDTAAALGGGAAAGTTAGGITAPSYTITKTDASTTTVNNVGAAVNALNNEVVKAITFNGTTGTTNQKLGSSIAVIGDSKNISTAVTTNQIKVSISDNPTFTTVTTGNSKLDNTGLTITGGPSVTTGGINAANTVISNVAAPTAGTDATNKTYVDSKAAASRTEVAAGSNVSGVVKTTGANGQDIYTVNANGTTASAGSSAVTVTPGTKDANNVTDYKVDLSATTKTDIQKGVDAKNAVDTAGLKFKGDTATTSNTKKLGDTVSITGDTNISTVATTDGVQVKLNPNLDLGATGSVKTGNTTINNAGVTADQVTVGGVVINNTSGINAGGKAITNVAAPTNNTDAANKKYVDDAGTALTNLGFGLKAQDGTTVNKKLGEAVDIVGSNSNISTKVNAGKVEVALSNTLDLGTTGSVTTGSTVINNAGVTANKVTINNAPTAGTDATNKTYVDSKAAASRTEVAAGSNVSGVVKTTGANGQDIYTVNANGTTASAGSSAVTVTPGTKDANNVTDYKVDLSATTKTDIQKGVDAKNAVDTAGLKFKGDTATTSNTKKLGDTVSITGDTNISTVATTDGVQVKLNPNLDLGATGSVKTGNTTINNAGVTADQVTVGGVVINNTSGINAGGKAITNVAAPTNNTDAANKKYVDDAGTALTNLGFGLKAQDGTTVNKKLGEAVDIVGSNSNISTKVNAGKVEVALSNTLDLGTTGSVTTGSTVINNAGVTANKVTINNAPTAGTDATNKTYVDSKAAASRTEVAAGSNVSGVVKTTGANGQDIYTVNANGTTASAGSSAVTVTPGTKDANNVTDYKVDLSATTKTDIQKGVDAKTAVDTTGLKFKGDTATTSNTKKLGDTVSITGDTNISTVATTDGVQVKLNPNLDLGATGSVKTGNTTINNAGVTADQVTVGGVVINNTSGINAGGKAITNVAAPTNNTDAANKKYVDDAGTALTNLGFGLKAQDGTTVNKKLGEAVEVVGADSNITTKVAGGQVAIELNKNLNNLTGITVNDGTNGTNGSTVIGKDGISVKDGSGNTIAGVDNTALTVKDGSGNTETSINQAINTLNAAQGETDKFAVKYDKNADGSANYNNVTLAGTNGTTISNVKAGAVTSTSTDAINGSQLYGVANSVKNAIGGSTTIDATTGAITTTNIGGTGSNTIDGAISSIKDSATKAKTTVSAGDNVVVTSGTNADGSTNYEVATAKDVNFDKVTVGSVVVDKSSNTIKGLSNTTWNGTAVSGQAATEDQLKMVSDAQGETDKFAVKYDKNADGSANYNNITLAGTTASSTQDATTGKITTTGGTSLNNVASAGDYKDVANASKGVNAGDLNNAVVDATNAATSKGFALQAADGAKVQKNLGEAVEVVGADSNITTKVAGGQVAIELNKNLNNLTGITVNDGTNGTNGSTVIGKDGISVKDGSGNTIAGVDNTALTVKDGSGNTETSINQAINTLNAAQGETDKFAVKYDKNADGSANYNNVTLAGTNGTTISNVKAGAVTSTSTDAINGSQLYGVANSVKNAIGGSTTIDATTGAITTTNIGGTGSNTIDGAISSIKDSATKAKTTVSAGDNVVVTSGTNADGSTNYEVATAKDVNFDKVTVGSVVVDKSSNTIKGLSNTTWNGTAVSGQAATEDQLKMVSDAQGETDKFAVKYDKNADGSANYNNITLAGTTASSTQDATTGKITTTGGTSLNNVASAGDYKDVANASKGVNAGDLNNAVVDATNAATSKGFALQAADGAKVQKNLGEAVEVVGADSNITTKVAGGQVAIELNKNLNNLTGITVNDGTNGNNGSTVIGKDGISVKDGSGNTIAGVDNTALTVKDGSGNTETSINQAINTLNAAQGETDKFAVKYDKNADGSANYNNITLAGTTASSTQDATTGKITTTGGTSLNNVASAGDYKDVANASKGVNAGDLNNAVVDATNAATSKGFALQAADGAKVQKNLGEAVEVVGADSNITTKVAGGQVAIELNKNLNNLTGITVNDGTNGNNGSTVIGKDGISVKDGSGNTIAGVDNTALTVKDGSGNTETSINQAINTLNAAQGETDKFAVKYDKNADGSANYNNITLAGTTASSTQDATTGKITTTGGTSLNNVASAGDYKDVANASKGVNAGDLNNAVVDATNAATSKGFALQAADGAKVQKNLGEAVEVVGADSNITTKVAGGQVAIELNKNLNNLTGITVNDGTNGTNGSTVIGKDGISVKDGSGNTIAGVDNTALTVKDGSGNTETSINQAINTLNAAQGETDKFAVKYDKNADGSANYNNITLAGTTASSTQDATTGKITTTGGTSLNNVASAGDYKDVANASKGVNAGDLNNAVVDATNAATSKGFALQAADGAKVQKNLGEAVEVVGADSNITTKVAGGQVAIELNKNLNNLTGITVNDGTNGTNGSTVIGKDGISVKDGSGNTIAGVDNTALTVKDGSGNTETSINQAINTLNAAQGETDKFAVKYDKNADGSVNYNNVTLAGTNGTIIRNVKAGAVTSTSTDAINGSQLYDIANSVKNAIGGSTTRDVTTGAITTTNIGGTGSNTIDGAISSIKDSATKAKTTISAGDNVVVTSGTNADGSTNYEVATAKDVNFDKVTVGNVVVDKANDTIQGLSNKDLNSSDFATKGRAATEEQLKAVITSNITEVVDGNGNKVNIIDQVVNTKPDNKNQDSLFLTYDKQGQETTDRLTIGQTVQKMNTDGIKFFHTNADTSKGDLGTTNDSSAGGLNSTAIGVNAIVANGADSSVALGHNTKVNGKQSIAIGSGAEALGNQSISIGTGNKVTGDHSGAIGDPTIVNGANSYSVGNNNQVLTDDTFVLGNNVTKTVAGSVVLGNGSAATTGAGEAGYALSVATNADKAAINKTTSSTGAVAVGDASSGIYRQITGVAAGSVDSDAVNVAQLKAVGNQVVTTQTTLVNSLGGNAKVNADGTITGPTYNVAQGNQTNVGDALTALDNAINTAATTSKSTVSNGQNIVVSKSKNADGSDNYEVSTAKDLTVDSVKAGDTVLNNAGITIGNNAVVLNNTGLTISGGPSVTLAGINAGNKTIQNVANAVNATDAVNKGQLDSAINNVNNNVNELANNAVKYDDASKDKITLGGGTTGTTITNVKDGTVAQGSKDAVNGGQLWNVQQQVDQNTTDISNIKNDINNGTVGLVQQAGKDAPVTVAKDTGGTTVNVAGTDGNRVVTGVKEGAVNATSKDAVNGSQLNTTNQAVVNYLGGGAGYDNITGSFTAPSYTVGDSKYNNVGGAIDALNQADQALNSKIDNVSNKLDNAFRITNNRIDDVEKKANAGIAAAMALESAPYVPGKYTYAAGAAYHGGENAVGVTLRKTADNGRWSITGGVAAASQGDASVRIGISGVID
ncbi:trimeric autotransporter adhesin AtaA [Acinetobacter bereziniae]|nr:ESPR-type extended signal peptide-containing protein [Acinetobacter bereziniae]